MNKPLLIFALLLGLAAGLFWPLGQNDQLQVTELPAIGLPPLVEVLANQQSVTDETKDQPEPQAEPNPQPPIPPAGPNSAQEKPKSAPKPPAPAPTLQANAKPKIRVVKGQTPEEVIQSFRRSEPVERSISQPDVALTINEPPAPAPNRQPNITTPKPAPKPQPVNGNHCYLAYGYTGWHADIAFAVCMGESSGKPRAINPRDKHNGCNGSYGLFQIACIHANPDDMLDPKLNVKKAYEIYQRNGWQPWAAYTGGSYQRYLSTSP